MDLFHDRPTSTISPQCQNVLVFKYQRLQGSIQISNTDFTIRKHPPFIPIPKQGLVYMCLQYMSYENTPEKVEIARQEQFLLFQKCFLPFKELSRIFTNFKIVGFKHSQFGSV